MPNDEATKAIVKAAARIVPATLDWLTSGLVTELRVHIADALANGDSRLAAAALRDQAEMLETVSLALSAVTKATTGRTLNGPESFEAVIAAASDPSSRRRVRALLNECATSTDERIAMLAVGYFVGASEPGLQDRLEWALRSLFPSDADTLAAVVKRQELVGEDGYILLTTSGAWDAHVTLKTKRSTARAMEAFSNRDDVPMESLRALSAARCIEIVPGGDGFRPTAPMASDGRSLIEVQSLRLLPLGEHLNATLSKVDWRAIAGVAKD